MKTFPTLLEIHQILLQRVSDPYYETRFMIYVKVVDTWRPLPNPGKTTAYKSIGIARRYLKDDLGATDNQIDKLIEYGSLKIEAI